MSQQNRLIGSLPAAKTSPVRRTRKKDESRTMTAASGEVLSVNVSTLRTVEHDGRTVVTGIFKVPVAGRVAVHGVNVHGDDQADRENHGGKDRAIYAYAGEDYTWWEGRLGRTLAAGKFGENLTLSGIDVSGALIGERWRAGTTEFQVTSPRVPCYKLAMTMGEPAFVRDFAQAARPGAYLSIVAEGDIAAGDEVSVAARPTHGLTLQQMFRIYMFERKRLAELLVPELPSSWRDWVLDQLANR